MQQLTAQLIADFATDEAMAQLLFQHNACKYICVLLTKSRAEEGVQVAACQAVCSLSHHPPARAFFGGFLPALLKRMIEAHGSSALATETVMRTVASLCQPGGEPTIADAFGAASFCEAVLSALERSEEGVVYEAMRALGSLALSSPANYQRLRDLGTLEALRACQAKWKELRGGKGVVYEEVCTNLYLVPAIIYSCRCLVQLFVLQVACATRLFEASSAPSVLSPKQSLLTVAAISASDASPPNHVLKAPRGQAPPSEGALPVEYARKESVGAVGAIIRHASDASAPTQPLKAPHGKAPPGEGALHVDPSKRESVGALVRRASDALPPNQALKAPHGQAPPGEGALPADPARRESVGAMVRRASVEIAARRDSTDRPAQAAGERRLTVDTANKCSSADVQSVRQDFASPTSAVDRRISIEASNRRQSTEPGPSRRDSALQAPGVDRRSSAKELGEPGAPRSPMEARAACASPTSGRRSSAATVPRCMSPQGKDGPQAQEGADPMLPSLPNRSSDADVSSCSSPKIRVSASVQSPVNLSTECSPTGSPLPRLSGRRASSALMTPPASAGGSSPDGPGSLMHKNNRRASLKAPPGSAGMLFPKLGEARHT